MLYFGELLVFRECLEGVRALRLLEPLQYFFNPVVDLADAVDEYFLFN